MFEPRRTENTSVTNRERPVPPVAVVSCATRGVFVCCHTPSSLVEIIKFFWQKPSCGFWLACDRLWSSLLPPGELCINWVPAVMTWVNDNECQSGVAPTERRVKGFVCLSFNKLECESFEKLSQLKPSRILICCLPGFSRQHFHLFCHPNSNIIRPENVMTRHAVKLDEPFLSRHLKHHQRCH